MHAHKNITILFFHFALFPFSYLWLRPLVLALSSSQTLQKTCLTNLDLEDSFISLTLLLFPFLFSFCVPQLFAFRWLLRLLKLSPSYPPHLYCQGSGADEAKQNALYVTVEKDGPWGDSSNCGAREILWTLLQPCRASHLDCPWCIPMNHRGSMQWMHLMS